jgi:acyl-CoA dehydrogenase
MSEIAEMVSATVARLFAEAGEANRSDGHLASLNALLWSQCEEMGMTSILRSEESGGMGSSWHDAFGAFHAVGYHRVSLPLLETILAGWALERGGMDVPTGVLTVVPTDKSRIALEKTSRALYVTGTANFVPWASSCRYLVLEGCVDGLSAVVLLDPSTTGIEITRGSNMAGEPRDRLVFERCAAGASIAFNSPLGLDLCGALLRSIAVIGAAEFALDLTVRYATERVQFGRTIGGFQAIQQSLAELAGCIATAKTAALFACPSPGENLDWRRIAVAKICGSEAASAAARISHQVHGALGFTAEYSLSQATTRLWAWRAEYGTQAEWAQRLGASVIERWREDSMGGPVQRVTTTRGNGSRGLMP